MLFCEILFSCFIVLGIIVIFFMWFVVVCVNCMVEVVGFSLLCMLWKVGSFRVLKMFMGMLFVLNK